jgi:hypothetical protein
MPRSPIRNKDKDVITDDGSVLMSVAKGEQIHWTFTATTETDLTGFTLTATVAEGANQPGDLTEVPFQEDSDTPTVTTLPIVDADASDNVFVVVIPHDLCDSWAVQPTPDDPVYGFFALQVADTGIGDNQQIRVPVRGLIEVRYNPVESGA